MITQNRDLSWPFRVGFLNSALPLRAAKFVYISPLPIPMHDDIRVYLE